MSITVVISTCQEYQALSAFLPLLKQCAPDLRVLVVWDRTERGQQAATIAGLRAVAAILENAAAAGHGGYAVYAR